MRLLRWDSQDELSLTKDLGGQLPPYAAILSHTWSINDEDEVTLADFQNGRGQTKPGWTKIEFCKQQAKKDGIEHFWIDTCCIDKTNSVELSEAIASMFRWYQNATKCYVFLSDVSTAEWSSGDQTRQIWETNFRNCRWFRRGWTLQELLAPPCVQFFSNEKEYIDNRESLAHLIHEITGISFDALCGTPISHFTQDERMRWADNRQTRKAEDRAYCLMGIFDVFIPLIYGEGENAFRRLQDEISRPAGKDSSESAHVHWIVPRSTNPLFEGRETLLQDLETTLRDAVRNPFRREQCRIVVHGMGGQGKSEVCLQLAQRVRSIFGAVFWIDVSTSESAERSFLHVARKLTLPAESWEDALLEIANLKYPWLVILDNADDLQEDYLNYFPHGLKGVVLMTARNAECASYGTTASIALERLDVSEARRLLLKSACISKEQHPSQQADVDEVVRLLNAHPLALIQAGAYISHGHSTLANYPRLYERQRQRLLRYRPRQARSRYGDVYATFEVSANALQAMNTDAAKEALKLIPLFATCAPRRFPLSMFQAAWESAQEPSPDITEDTEDDEVMLLTPWHLAHLPAVLTKVQDAWDSFQLMEAVSLLRSMSLLTVEHHTDHVSVSTHALIHAWARDRQTEIEQHYHWVQMACVAAFALEDTVWVEGAQQQLQPHLEALSQWKVTTMLGSEPAVIVARLLVNLGWRLLKMRSDATLYTMLHEFLAQASLDAKTVDQRWIGLYWLRSRNLIDYGQVSEAVTLLEQVVKIREQSLAVDHPDRLASQHELARVYLANGQVKEAVVLLEQVVQIREQSLAVNHPDRLASQHVLAGAYQANGQVKEAVTLLEQVVQIQEQSLAVHHPSRLTSQHALAGAYEANGQVKEAVTLLEQVVQIQEQSLANDHPARLASRHNLAIYLWMLGDQQTAVSIMLAVVHIRRQVQDEHHPDRQGSEAWLSFFQQEMSEM